MKKVLIYRFSAMGDVVLLLPVIKGLISSNNNIEVYLLTRKTFFPVFKNIEKLRLIEADLKYNYKGFKGLYRLFKNVKKEVNPDTIIDLHKVLRTNILNFLFSISGYKVVSFSKGRKEKKNLIKSKQNKQLISTIDRYFNAVNKAGLKIKLAKVPLINNNTDISKLLPNNNIRANRIIGIAPFAKHKQKIWGIDKVEELIGKLSQKENITIVLFGGGNQEIETLSKIAKSHSNCIVAAKYLTFEEELSLITQLNLMVSMDSANMHLSSMAGVDTISIWGATHPKLGFSPYQQNHENIIQYNGDRLNCRPCSVYGNKKCIYSSVRCMELISVNEVYLKITSILKI